MLKQILLLTLLFFAINGFTVLQGHLPKLKDIPWPYTICGQGKWTVESVTLSSIPARNNNNLLTVVNFD